MSRRNQGRPIANPAQPRWPPCRPPLGGPCSTPRSSRPPAAASAATPRETVAKNRARGRAAGVATAAAAATSRSRSLETVSLAGTRAELRKVTQKRSYADTPSRGLASCQRCRDRGGHRPTHEAALGGSTPGGGRIRDRGVCKLQAWRLCRFQGRRRGHHAGVADPPDLRRRRSGSDTATCRRRRRKPAGVCLGGQRSRGGPQAAAGADTPGEKACTGGGRGF
eukprot:366309-Chlamydomonas_euryale.AAC.3